MAITMTAKDGRFSSQIGVVTAITDSTAFNDLGGKGKTLSYIQLKVTAGTANANKMYLSLYNTADVTVGTTDAVLKVEIPLSSAGPHVLTIPTGLYLNSAVSFALSSKDNLSIATDNSSGSAPTVEVKFVFT